MALGTMTDQLDAVREAVPGCSVVAFADLSARLVLCVSASRRPPQEVLDQLCEMAVELLDGAAAQSATRALSPGQSRRSRTGKGSAEDRSGRVQPSGDEALGGDTAAGETEEGGASADAVDASGDRAADTVDCAIALPPGQSYLFLRSATDPVEALCCIGSAAMDLGAAEDALRRTLAGIEAQA